MRSKRKVGPKTHFFMRSIRNEIGKGTAKTYIFMRSIRNEIYGTK